jgi:riboflavin biosynthesis pyrimidine reductase
VPGGSRSRARHPEPGTRNKTPALEGGGNANGSFLRAGPIDEISLAIFPALDGTKGAPCVFDSSDEEAGMPAPIRVMTLENSEVLEGGVVWLRYCLQSA